MKSNSNKNLWYVLGGAIVLVLVVALGVSVTGQTTGACVDSDGTDVYTAGWIRYKVGSVEARQGDSCVDSNRVKEYICREGAPASVIKTCKYGCSRGACLKTPPSRPDLIITSQSPSNFRYRSGSETYYDYAVTVKNVGTAATNGNVLITALLRLGDLNSYTLSQSQPRSLAPGEETTLTTSRLVCISELSYQTTARVDNTNVIVESEENNNVHTSTFTCPRMPTPSYDVDLIILGQEVSNMRANTTSITGAKLYDHSVTIQNLGTSSTGNFYATVNMLRTGLDGSSTNQYVARSTSLAAGASTVLTNTFECRNGVFYDVQSTVNPPLVGAPVGETNYDNNVDEYEFQC